MPVRSMSGRCAREKPPRSKSPIRTPATRFEQHVEGIHEPDEEDDPEEDGEEEARQGPQARGEEAHEEDFGEEEACEPEFCQQEEARSGECSHPEGRKAFAGEDDRPALQEVCAEEGVREEGRCEEGARKGRRWHGRVAQPQQSAEREHQDTA